jgi:hypothetical protein
VRSKHNEIVSDYGIVVFLVTSLVLTVFFVFNNSIHETVHVYRGYTPHVWRFKAWKC